MDRRGFIKSLGFIAGGLAFGGVKAVKGVAKAAIAAEKPSNGLPKIVRSYAKTVTYDLIPPTPMAMPIGRLYYMDSAYAGNELTNILSENIANDIDRELLSKIEEPYFLSVKNAFKPLCLQT